MQLHKHKTLDVPLHFKITKTEFQHAKLHNPIAKQTKPVKKNPAIHNIKFMKILTNNTQLELKKEEIESRKSTLTRKRLPGKLKSSMSRSQVLN
jgi:hypothetical protein